jgi:hypothetical protein
VTTRVEEAIAAVDSRLSGIRRPDLPPGPDNEGLADVESIALTCAGSDIPGTVLARLLLADVDDILRRAGAGHDDDPDEYAARRVVLEAYVRGMALRFFWLGYEFGKDAEF